ncbi:otolith matrix protein OMM-64 [Neodiprion lecontei]|uniref:Otolith matrix protein OMM-64 n=1 Tax=Neodiprion lecontei TaxID=441921 RepID=A0ABM3GLV7_NEOLC|nr:otolith matrix protein OMM-64 [Neodiprion lecontei]
MRLSTVFELLLIFLLVAFAAYARVIDRHEVTSLHRVIRATKQSNVGVSTISLKQATDNVNKYCTCNDNICNCCRNFDVPFLQLKGAGCASVQYLKGDNMALQLSFGDNILTSTVVNGKNPKPVCVPLPGGFSKFCGRIYSIQREATDHFKACLGLELESSKQVEASLRVSCFRFGPDGLKLRPAEPLPIVEADSSSDDDDDEDDIFGLGSDDDDDEDDDDDDDEEDDDDDDDAPTGNAVPSSSADDDDEDDDVFGLGSFFDIFGDDDTPKKPKVTTPSPLPVSIPLLTKPISEAPAVTAVEPVAPGNDIPVESGSVEPPKPVEEEVPASNAAEEVTDQGVEAIADPVADSETAVNAVDDLVPLGSVIQNNVVQPADSPVEEGVQLPELDTGTGSDKVKVTVKKPAVTSSSINAIQTDVKKPVATVASKPEKPEVVQGESDESEEEESEEDDEDEDEDDVLEADDLDEDDDEKEESVEDESEKEEDEDEDEKKPEDVELESDEESIIDDDDDDEDEAALLTALSSDEKDEKVKKDQVKVDKISTNEAEDPEADDADYGFGMAEMLARKRNQKHARPGRQSRIMRL